MKPYHLINCWLDLDAVSSVSDFAPKDPVIRGLEFSVIMAFCDKPLTFYSRVWDEKVANGVEHEPRDTYYDRVSQILDTRFKEAYGAFLVAWKTKDTMFGASK